MAQDAAPFRLPTWLLVVACVVPFLGFWTYGLFDLDEGFYGAVVVDMLRRGDWITPTFNGEPWFEKPILAYWTAMPAFLAFGEWVGPRLPSVLATLATVFVLYRFAVRHFGVPAAQITALAYASSLLVVGVGRMMLTDGLLTLCLTAAFTTFYDSLQGRPKLRYWTALWLGLAVLAKGPFGLAVFGVVMLWTLAREKELRPGFRGGWPLGLLILFGVIASWYVPAYLASGQVFVQEFLIEQNIGRLTGGDLAHRLPDWAWWAHPIYYPLVLLVGGAPWTWFGAAELFKPQERNALYRYLAAWAPVIVILFTLSGSKLPHYGLPAIAPLVLLAARRLALAKPVRWLRFGVAWAVVVGVIAQLGFYYAYHLDTTYHYAEAHRIARYLRNQPGDVALYRFGRQGPATPELGLERVATSMPSLLFYLQRPAIKADDPGTAAQADWLFARSEVVDEETLEELRAGGVTSVPVAEIDTEHYVLYRLSRSDG